MEITTILSPDYDKLNPLGKYEQLKAELTNDLTLDFDFVYANNLGEIILLALCTVDTILKKEGGAKYNYYIFDDLSVKNLIEKSFNIQLKHQSFINHLILIDEAKLIYRFTCAKKFMIPDDSIKQLRLNSWGHEYIKVYELLNKYADAFSVLQHTFIEYFRGNREIYLTIMDYLIDVINSEKSVTIQACNEKLDIKLLS